MRITKIAFLFFSFILLDSCTSSKTSSQKHNSIWTEKEANAWYGDKDWLVGPNFIPSTAINQLEMWQESTFDTTTIDRELGWASDLGMNTARVYLHDLVYEQDSVGFLNRMEKFLEISDKHGIKPLFVFFDSCWDPFPELGIQRQPKPYTHNSGWVQSPSQSALQDTAQYPRLERYIKGVIKAFAKDDRIVGWDVWNEPDNPNSSSYGKVELPNKLDYVLPLLKSTFEWARAANPTQPLTSGIWAGNWESHETLKPIEVLQIEKSDIISFHSYDNAEEFEKRVKLLQRYNKPILCTEYMARVNGSTFETFLPIAKKYNVGMYNWGFVSGKTQTIFPWDSWSKVYIDEPPVWFHDVFRKDGTPYRSNEVVFIKNILSDR